MAQDFILREGWGVAKQKRESIQVQEEGTCGLKGKKLGPALTVLKESGSPQTFHHNSKISI